MGWGAAAYLPNGENVVTTYTPYNRIKAVPVVAAVGTHTIVVNELPAGSRIEYSIETLHPAGANATALISGIWVSGNRITYTVSTVYPASVGLFEKRAVFYIYAVR